MTVSIFNVTKEVVDRVVRATDLYALPYGSLNDIPVMLRDMLPESGPDSTVMIQHPVSKQSVIFAHPLAWARVLGSAGNWEQAIDVRANHFLNELEVMYLQFLSQQVFRK